jgi:hypothetical protein
MPRPVTLIKAVSSAAAILILAAGCTSQSPTAPTADQKISAPTGAKLGLYTNNGG